MRKAETQREVDRSSGQGTQRRQKRGTVMGYRGLGGGCDRDPERAGKGPRSKERRRRTGMTRGKRLEDGKRCRDPRGWGREQTQKTED